MQGLCGWSWPYTQLLWAPRMLQLFVYHRVGPSVPRPPSAHSTPRSEVSLYRHLPSLAAEDSLNHITRDPRQLALG